MRKFTRLFSLLAVLLPSLLSANVIVHGRVKYTNGTGVAGMAVHISGDSALANPGACYQNHTTYTNSTGFYTDTLVCNANMSTVLVWMMNCNGSIIRQNYTLTANQNVESNFTYCDSTISNQCHAFFSWQATNLEVHFNSSGSSAGNPLPDSIITRTWTFGDGVSLSGNVINPVHVYAQPGSYTICLKIKTASGCESTICNTINIISGNITCAANFNWERIPGTTRVRFNSSASTTSAPDSIISRKWRFGDGDTLTGNVIFPEHTYAQPGTYTACLIMRTGRGCESTVCKVVTIQPLNVSCNASFYTQLPGSNIVGQSIIFNSSSSTVASGDSILQRLWNFGDGTTGSGVALTHIYTQPGLYTICLTIHTASGCLDTTCIGLAIIALPSTRCEAIFSLEHLPVPPAGSNPAFRYVRFNSAGSHGATISDSIISRTWNFGDSSSNITGNQVNPLHGYAQGGPYNACLYILTQSGCRDTICHTVVLPSVSPNCEPRFTTTATGLSVVFASSSSSVPSGDSIVSRSWTFGDGAGAGNTVTVTHQYANVGTYSACLTIRTRLGCVKTWCKTVTVINVSATCVPYFTKEQTSTPRTIRFNSSASYSQLPNDTIIGRKWEFGDGQILTGNVINPLHTYALGGTYNVCLTIYTRNCDKRWCQTVQVLPLTNNQGDSLSIINLYPIPVTTQLNAVIYSGRPNVNAELAIYDVYGVRKWYQTAVLPFGNSTYNIPTSQLATGPYIFKLTTQYGVRSRNFFKVN